jgi:hypothetical protein
LVFFTNKIRDPNCRDTQPAVQRTEIIYETEFKVFISVLYATSCDPKTSFTVLDRSYIAGL